MSQDKISTRNVEFWDELCGSQLAKSLGITDSSQESLKKFDNWYFDFYPYLLTHIPFEKMKGKNVLEVGLGYGTVSQRLSESGANYVGLDIAAGPVAMANHRLEHIGLPPSAVQGSILDPEFSEASFDYIVAIGCGPFAHQHYRLHRLATANHLAQTLLTHLKAVVYSQLKAQY